MKIGSVNSKHSSKKKVGLTVLLLSTAIVLLCWGYRSWSQAKFYSLVKDNESVEQLIERDSDAYGILSEDAGVQADLAASDSYSYDDGNTAIARIQRDSDLMKTYVYDKMPNDLSQSDSALKRSNLYLKWLWLNPSQKRDFAALNSNYRDLTDRARKLMPIHQDIFPAQQEVIKVMSGLVAIKQFSTYASKDQMTSNIAQLSSLQPFASANYSYEGESVIKRNYPTIYTWFNEADLVMSDAYNMFSALANGDNATALALEPGLTKAFNSLGSLQDPTSTVMQKYAKPADDADNLALENILNILEKSNDKRFKSMIGIEMDSLVVRGRK